MNFYLKLSTMEWPLYEGDIRLEHPNISEELTGESFPCPDGYALVKQDPMPQYDSTLARLNILPPVFENNTWVAKWSDPVYFTEDELAQMEQDKRDNLKNLKIRDLSLKGSAPDVIG